MLTHADVCIRQHTSACVSIRSHVHTQLVGNTQLRHKTKKQEKRGGGKEVSNLHVGVRPHVRVREEPLQSLHMSTYVSMYAFVKSPCSPCIRQHTSDNVSEFVKSPCSPCIRQHSSADVSIRQHYVSIRQITCRGS
jgi:hypothetical protein